MSSTVRWAGLALLAVVAAASPARSQDATTGDSTSAVVAPPRITTGSIPGRAGLGGLLGGSWFYASEDFGRGALPRFDITGQFRYQIGSRWRFQVSPGFTWSAYNKFEPPPFTDVAYPADRTKEHYLVQLTPISTELQWVRRGRVWTHHFGAGPGLYRIVVQNHRKYLKDPTTFRVHRGVYLGATAEYGVERYFKSLPNTSVEVNLANHWINARRNDQFPNGWNSWIGAVALRVGVNYYFDVTRLKPKEQIPLPKSAGGKK
jgi:hypothetical protein